MTSRAAPNHRPRRFAQPRIALSGTYRVTGLAARVFSRTGTLIPNLRKPLHWFARRMQPALASGT